MTRTADKVKVYVNGSLVGFHENASKLKEELLSKRRKGTIDSQINVAYFKDTNEIYVNTDGGRVQRPLIVVERGKSKLRSNLLEDLKKSKINWADLVKKGVIEYIDAEEEENAYVALKEEELTPDHTHLEISGTSIFSVITSMVPFVEHNQAGKAIHGAKLFKQATGLPSTNYKLRFDTEMHVLYYPQKALVSTRTEDLISLHKRPMIQNAVVAIMPYKGFNMLDAYVINKGSVQRAFARSSYYRSYSCKENRYPSGQSDTFTVPDESTIGYKGEEEYNNLDEEGVGNIETYVGKGGVLIGMTSPPRFVEEVSDFGVVNEERRDSSLCARKHLDGYIDRIMITETLDGSRLAKVKVRTEMVPEVGDKFTSHHAQKGVIGGVIEEEDMPFNSRGIKPDIILSPHSIPSRMTLGHLFETIAGKSVALSGKEIDGTPFYNDRKYIEKLLKSLGFRPDGKEVFYDGRTGKRIEMPIFVGPLAYERLLSHTVINRVQARDKGPVQLLTRQPTEGKQKGGGLRFGEMEAEALVAHGAAMALQGRLIDNADEIELLVCSKCGVPAVEDKIRSKYYCPLCKGGDVYKVKTSYGFKLLLYEMISMGVYPKIVVGDKVE